MVFASFCVASQALKKQEGSLPCTATIYIHCVCVYTVTTTVSQNIRKPYNV